MLLYTHQKVLPRLVPSIFWSSISEQQILKKKLIRWFYKDEKTTSSEFLCEGFIFVSSYLPFVLLLKNVFILMKYIDQFLTYPIQKGKRCSVGHAKFIEKLMPPIRKLMKRLYSKSQLSLLGYLLQQAPPIWRAHSMQPQVSF